MKIYIKNTVHGLYPLYPEDHEKKAKLKIGESYLVEIKKARNIDFHRKYFALINCAWEYQSEKRQGFFKNDKTNFRKTIEVSSGYCDTIFNLKLRSWIDIPKSVSFDKMDEYAFGKLYESVRNVIFQTLIEGVSEKEFMENLMNF